MIKLRPHCHTNASMTVVNDCANAVKELTFGWKCNICTCLISTLGLNIVKTFVLFIKLDFILAWMLSCSWIFFKLLHSLFVKQHLIYFYVDSFHIIFCSDGSVNALLDFSLCETVSSAAEDAAECPDPRTSQNNK